MGQVAAVRLPRSRLVLLDRLSAAAAVMVGLLLTVGLAGLLGATLRPNSPDGWSLPLQDNWLARIYKLLAGFGGDQAGKLHEVDLLDIAILALVGIVFLGLFAELSQVSRLWSLLAALSPFAGIGLFLATASAGRTGVIGAVLIVSIVMLWSTSFGKPVAAVGILASVLLATGDVSSSAGPLLVIGVLFGLGYVLVTAWFFLVAAALLRLEPGRRIRSQQGAVSADPTTEW